MDALCEKLKAFNKESNNQIEVKSTITEIKNTLEGINSRLNDTGQQMSEPEDRVVQITATELNTHFYCLQVLFFTELEHQFNQVLCLLSRGYLFLVSSNMFFISI